MFNKNEARVRLHEHTDNSTNDSAMSIKEFVDRAKELGIQTLAMTNHGTMQGHLAFYKACKKAGINPVMGFEAYADLGMRTFKKGVETVFRNHLIFLAKDEIGYYMVSNLATAGWRNIVTNAAGKAYPVVTVDMIKEIISEPGHVVCTSACMQGIGAYLIKDFFQAHLVSGLEEDAMLLTEKTMLKFNELFGNGNFFIEVQNHGIEAEAELMPKLVDIARKHNIPLIAADDAHMARKSEEDVLRRAISQSIAYQKWYGIEDSDRELYMKNDFEMYSALRKIIPEDAAAEAVNNLNNSGNLFGFEFPEEKPAHYPRFFKDDPDGSKAYNRLVELCNAGHKKYPEWTTELQARQDYELEVMKKMDVVDYQLIVQENNRMALLYGCFDEKEDVLALGDKRFDAEFLEAYIKEHNLIGLGKGPGRGSAAGSLVCYLTGITDIDPIKYNLLFERFLNPSRVSMPDIDIDYPDYVRELVLDFVKNKYGNDAVACIITETRCGVRGAIQNAGIALKCKMIYDYILLHKIDVEDKVQKKKAKLKGKEFKTLCLNASERLSKLVPDELGITFADCFDKLMSECENDTERQILNWAKLIEGLHTSDGMHAAGVVITPGPVSDYCPLMYDTKNAVWKTQIDMIEVEEQGLLKIDFLGLNNLKIITKTMKLKQKETGEEIDIMNIPFDDKRVFEEIFSRGFTNSVFQFESPGMKKMLMQAKPESMEDLTALVALYRPGPMDFIPQYLEGKKNPDKVKYKCPQLEPILKPTYGCIVYQGATRSSLK